MLSNPPDQKGVPQNASFWMISFNFFMFLDEFSKPFILLLKCFVRFDHFCHPDIPTNVHFISASLDPRIRLLPFYITFPYFAQGASLLHHSLILSKLVLFRRRCVKNFRVTKWIVQLIPVNVFCNSSIYVALLWISRPIKIFLVY